MIRPQPSPRSPEKLQSAGPSTFADGVLDAVGQTPVLRLRRVLAEADVELFAKWEAANPGGSMKDRPARRMIETALRSGRLRPGGLVVESSSGNMGIGLAQACRYHGLRFVCIVDPRIQATNARLIEVYGGELDRVTQPDPETGDFLTARLNRVREWITRHPDAFWPNQYANPENPAAHRIGTAAELHRTVGKLDAVFVAVSSTGTVGGFLDYFSRHSPDTEVIAVDSTGSVLFGGQAGERRISGMGAGLHPPLSQSAYPHRVIRVSDLDCVIGCRRLIGREALLVGGSGGGVIEAVRRMLPQFSSGSRIGLVLGDGGDRYLETVYNDSWVEQELGCARAELDRLIDA